MSPSAREIPARRRSSVSGGIVSGPWLRLRMVGSGRGARIQVATSARSPAWRRTAGSAGGRWQSTVVRLSRVHPTPLKPGSAVPSQPASLSRAAGWRSSESAARGQDARQPQHRPGQPEADAGMRLYRQRRSQSAAMQIPAPGSSRGAEERAKIPMEVPPDDRRPAAADGAVCSVRRPGSRVVIAPQGWKFCGVMLARRRFGRYLAEAWLRLRQIAVTCASRVHGPPGP